MQRGLALSGLLASLASTITLTALCPVSWQPWVQLTLAAAIAAAITARSTGHRPESGGHAPRTRPVEVVDLIAPDRSRVGCVDGDRVVTTAVELAAGSLVITEVGRDEPVSDHSVRLPLSVIARQLDQGGVVLEGIDVVVRGRRASRADDGEVYSRLVGTLPLVSHRRVHLLIRFDLSRLVARGAESDPADRAHTVDSIVATATERVRRALVHTGLTCRVLDATELAELYLESEVAPTDGMGFTGRLSPETRSLVDRLPALGATEYVEVVRLRPVEGRRDVVDAVTSLSISGFPHEAGERDAEEMIARSATSGRRLHSAAATIPVPGERLPGPVAAHLDRYPINSLDRHAPSAHGVGQILGSTREGAAAAVPVVGPHIRSALLVAVPHVCLQVVFRVVASGHRVAVVTDVPDRWAPLSRIGDASRFRILSPEASDDGATVDAVVWDVDGPLSESRIDALSDPSATGSLCPTVIRVLTETVKGPVQDIAGATPDLVLDGRIDGWIALEYPDGESFRVTVVRGPGEESFLSDYPDARAGAEPEPSDSTVFTPAGVAPAASPDRP